MISTGKRSRAALSVLRIVTSTVLFGWCALAAAVESKNLTIYFIDVEGGQATLVVTPDGHSLLIDAGWAGDGVGFRPGEPRKARDANRIVAAARDAGIVAIDYLLVTHFHGDHIGGVSELSQLMPIRTFVDHGAPSPAALTASAETKAAFDAYEAVRSRGKHLEPRPGDRLPIEDVAAIVVSSAGATLAAPLPNAGTNNEACQDHATAPSDALENPRSTGIVLSYGRFRFLDLGDLSGQPLFDLVCPRNAIGPVDVYLVAHHGGADVADPATFAAFRPRVAIMNNGLKKGGAQATFQALHRASTIESVWQLHASAVAAESNFPAEYIANLDESTAHWIKLIAKDDGSFRVLNPRTEKWQSYPGRGTKSVLP